jgi:hypothetical protein
MASMIEIAGYAFTAGLRNPAKLAMAVAIAEAESGGNPNSHNGKGADDSYGVWQINMKAHTTGELGISSASALYDPVTNARAMVKISNSGANWGPWSTYPLPAAAFLPAAVAAYLATNPTAAGSQYVAAGAGVVSDATGIDALAQGVTEAVQAPLKVLNWLTESGTWVRIALFGLGGAMVIGGLLIFARPAVESGAKTAMKILPAGKAGSLMGAAGKGSGAGAAAVEGAAAL